MSARALLAGAAVALAAGAVGVTGASPGSGDPGWVGATELPAGATIGAVELARAIREGGGRLRVLDLRGADAFEEGHVPLARRVRPGRFDVLRVEPGATLVVYSASEARAARARSILQVHGHSDVRVLEGGYGAWLGRVMFPVLPRDPDPADRSDVRALAELSEYYGGRPSYGERETSVADPGAALRERIEDARAAGCGW